MSTYGMIYLEKLNKQEKKWEHYCLYDKDKDGNYKPLPLWIGQGYIRDILRDPDELMNYKSGLIVDNPTELNNCSDYVTSEYHQNESDPDEEGESYNYNFNCGTMTYGQLVYYLTRNPKYEGFEKKIKNPMREILRLINCVKDLKDEFDFDTSYLNEYRIVFWCA